MSLEDTELKSYLIDVNKKIAEDNVDWAKLKQLRRNQNRTPKQNSILLTIPHMCTPKVCMNHHIE